VPVAVAEMAGHGVHPAAIPAAGVRFAHPSEQVLAAIFDASGIRWSYEPVAFPLDWDGKGMPRSAFRPDFWLPELRCFVELTTADQRWVTRKNAKVRRMRELYPEIAVTVLYQRDFLAIASSHGVDLARIRAT